MALVPIKRPIIEGRVRKIFLLGVVYVFRGNSVRFVVQMGGNDRLENQKGAFENESSKANVGNAV